MIIRAEAVVILSVVPHIQNDLLHPARSRRPRPDAYTAALAVHDADIEALRNLACWVLLDGEQWPQLSLALVESHLRG
jgi:hypothetical protein